MYWNLITIQFCVLSYSTLNRHIWCIETRLLLHFQHLLLLLNRHIWCIETEEKDRKNSFFYKIEPTHLMYWNLCLMASLVSLIYWTDTFDVLKLAIRLLLYTLLLQLNRHIWCIETPIEDRNCVPAKGIEPTHLMYWNSSPEPSSSEPSYWTDTFDVLKPPLNLFLLVFLFYWTDTFDVLKQDKYSDLSVIDPELNRHIWCIETTH